MRGGSGARSRRLQVVFGGARSRSQRLRDGGALAPALVVVLLALVAPTGATASSVGLEGEGEGQHFVYRAAPGERNELSIKQAAVTTLFDPGARIDPGRACRRVATHRVRCTSPGPTYFAVEVRLGDRHDVSTSTGNVSYVLLDGGDGGDSLTGGPSSDLIGGGKGADRIDALGGDYDTLTYGGRAQRVSVTLGDGLRNDGGRLDGDRRDLIMNFENVAGGRGDDRLWGDQRPNVIDGRQGDDDIRGGDEADPNAGDYLSGGPGDDSMLGGAGSETLIGGAGDDVMRGGSSYDFFRNEGTTRNGSDVIDAGGDSGDIASFEYRTKPVRMSLDGLANDGECRDVTCTASAEGDNITGVDRMIGGSAGDLLIGTDGREQNITPGAGPDRVISLGGDDTIYLDNDGFLDTVDCGLGNDTVYGADTIITAFDNLTNC